MHLTLGLWDIRDTQCGFKFFRGSVGRRLFCRGSASTAMHVRTWKCSAWPGSVAIESRKSPCIGATTATAASNLISGNWAEPRGHPRIRLGAAMPEAVRGASHRARTQWTQRLPVPGPSWTARKWDLYAGAKYEMILARASRVDPGPDVLNAGVRGRGPLLHSRAGRAPRGRSRLRCPSTSRSRSGRRRRPLLPGCTILRDQHHRGVQAGPQLRPCQRQRMRFGAYPRRPGRLFFAKLVDFSSPQARSWITVPAGAPAAWVPRRAARSRAAVGTKRSLRLAGGRVLPSAATDPITSAFLLIPVCHSLLAGCF